MKINFYFAWFKVTAKLMPIINIKPIQQVHHRWQKAISQFNCNILFQLLIHLMLQVWKWNFESLMKIKGCTTLCPLSIQLVATFFTVKSILNIVHPTESQFHLTFLFPSYQSKNVSIHLCHPFVSSCHSCTSINSPFHLYLFILFPSLRVWPSLCFQLLVHFLKAWIRKKVDEKCQQLVAIIASHLSFNLNHKLITFLFLHSFLFHGQSD